MSAPKQENELFTRRINKCYTTEAPRNMMHEMKKVSCKSEDQNSESQLTCIGKKKKHT